MFNLESIIQSLPFTFTVFGKKDATFTSVDSLFEARDNSLTWVRSSLSGAADLLENCLSSVVICDANLELSESLLNKKTFIVTERPDLAFLRVVKHLYRGKSQMEAFVHPTAIVNKGAIIGSGVYIGAYAQLGKCQIGTNSRIETFAKIHDNVIIGNNVLISEYCNIGGQGFGHIMDERNELENMLHIGKVIIEDNVEIFPYSNVDKATLSATRIKRNTKIDHYCHIGHNTEIGENTIITAKVVMCGGSKIGDFSWIGVGSIIRDSARVGNYVTLGMGSIVTKNIPDNSTWLGNPARPFEKPKSK